MNYFIIHIGLSNNDLTYLRTDANGCAWTLDSAIAYADAQQATDKRTGAYRVYEDHGFYREHKTVYVSGAAQPAPTKPAKELIKAASIARVTSKEGKFLGWGVKSNSSNEYYEVHCTKIAGECVWNCSCKAGQMNFSGCKDGKCCHVKAVIEVSQARKEMAKAAPVATVETPAQLPMVVRLCDSSTTVYVVSNGQYELVRISDLKNVCPNGYREDPDGALELFEMMHQLKAPKAKEITCKRAKQFAGMETLKALPLNGNQGVSLLKPAC